jgi:hypothetical protein
MRYRYHNQNTALSFMYRHMKKLEKLKYKARTGRLSAKMLDSGFYEDQTYGALQKAWVAYVISCKKDDLEKKQYYAAVIQKLQHELGIAITSFPELKLLSLDFVQAHPDWVSDDMSGDEILQMLLKSDNEFSKKIRNQTVMTIKREEQE